MLVCADVANSYPVAGSINGARKATLVRRWTMCVIARVDGRASEDARIAMTAALLQGVRLGRPAVVAERAEKRVRTRNVAGPRKLAGAIGVKVMASG